MSAYKTKRELAKEYGMCVRTVDTRIKGIAEEIGKGRYNRYALIEDSKIKVNEYVFLDYCKYHKMLASPSLRKTVPKFSPEKIRELMQMQAQICVPEGVAV